MLCLCHYGPALLRFCFQTNLGRENSASYLKIQARRPFLTRVTRWSRSTSNFYALIGQNVTGEFMRKIYEASWNLFTLTAGCTKWNTAAIKNILLFVASLLIGFFGWEMRRSSESEIRFEMASFSFFTFFDSVQFVLKILWNTAFCPRSVW